MTNQELMEEIKSLRSDRREDHKELQSELKELKKEFYIFKGKAFGFISLLSVCFNLAFNYLINKK